MRLNIKYMNFFGMRVVKNDERGQEHFCFPIMAMSSSLFRKGIFQLVDHPPRSDDPPS